MSFYIYFTIIFCKPGNVVLTDIFMKISTCQPRCLSNVSKKQVALVYTFLHSVRKPKLVNLPPMIYQFIVDNFFDECIRILCCYFNLLKVKSCVFRTMLAAIVSLAQSKQLNLNVMKSPFSTLNSRRREAF